MPRVQAAMALLYVRLGDDENIWVMFYSDSPYAAYCGKQPVDVNNGKLWYTTNLTNWYSNTTYTPVIYTRFLELPTGREVTVNLADMTIRESKPAAGQIAEAEGDVTITGGKGMYQPNMSALNLDVRTTGKTIASNIANAGEGFGASATNMTRDWLHYDSGTNSDAIGLTSGGGFYWGIMFPGNTYEGTRVTKIAYFDYAAHNGSFMIYQGGTSAPGTLLYTQAYNVSGTSQYIEIELDEAVEIDNTQNLWLVMHNNTGQYVAAIDETSYGTASILLIM